MKITQIRCREALPAFKGRDVFSVDDKTQVRMIPCGHFIVTVEGKSQLVPHSAVKVCDVDEDPVADFVLRGGEDLNNAKAYVSPENHAALTEKRGPGRPKKVAE